MSEPFQQQGLTRAERRAAQERARRRREALEAARAEGGLVAAPTTAQDLVETEEPEAPKAPKAPKARRRTRKRVARPGRRFVAGTAVAAVGFMVALGAGGPVLGHDWDYAYLAAGIGAVVAGGLFAWWNSLQTSRLTAGIALGVATLLCAAFAVGTFNSIVINGQVHPSTSDTAEAYRLAHELNDDLNYIAEVDPLLDAEQAYARAHYGEYGPAAERLAEISERWALVADKPEELPSAGFAEVAARTANGAHWAAEAMVRKQQLIVEPDARGEADVASYRATYAKEVLTAGPQLVEVARLYGITLTDEGPTE